MEQAYALKQKINSLPKLLQHQEKNILGFAESQILRGQLINEFSHLELTLIVFN